MIFFYIFEPQDEYLVGLTNSTKGLVIEGIATEGLTDERLVGGDSATSVS